MYVAAGCAGGPLIRLKHCFDMDKLNVEPHDTHCVIALPSTSLPLPSTCPFHESQHLAPSLFLSVFAPVWILPQPVLHHYTHGERAHSVHRSYIHQCPLATINNSLLLYFLFQPLILSHSFRELLLQWCCPRRVSLQLTFELTQLLFMPGLHFIQLYSSALYPVWLGLS